MYHGTETCAGDMPHCIEEEQPDAEYISRYFGNEKPDIQFYRGKGCDECNNEGYKGRVAVNELWIPTSKEIGNIGNYINNEDELRKNAFKHGLISFYQDGLTKLENKQTSLDELMRVFFNIEQERDL